MENSDQVREVLKFVYDPELGVNIIDLGLVYDICVDQDKVYVKMTLTTPGCPLHDTILGGVQRILRDKTDKEIEVDLVWEPKWSPQNMSENAKEQLGFF